MIEQIAEYIDFSRIDLSAWTTEIILTAAALIFLCIVTIIIRDSYRFIVREYYYCANGLKKNAKLLIIADLHNKQYGRHNGKLWNAVEAIAPDYIIIAGDMMTAHRGKENTAAWEFLRLLSSKYPVYYGNGNHELRFNTQPDSYGPAAALYDEKVAGLPVWRLRNESVHIPGLNMNIFGLDLPREYYQRFPKVRLSVDYLDGILGAPVPDAVNLLIAHNPEHFAAYAAWGADLVAAGHMHGGIVRLPLVGGLVSPRLTLFPRYDGGLYTEGRSTMVVSRGLGSHLMPLRLNNPGELVVVHMRH